MNTYYNPEDLAKFPTIGEEAPELGKKFFDYYGAVFADGELTAREKSRPTPNRNRPRKKPNKSGISRVRTTAPIRLSPSLRMERRKRPLWR